MNHKVLNAYESNPKQATVRVNKCIIPTHSTIISKFKKRRFFARKYLQCLSFQDKTENKILLYDAMKTDIFKTFRKNPEVLIRVSIYHPRKTKTICEELLFLRNLSPTEFANSLTCVTNQIVDFYGCPQLSQCLSINVWFHTNDKNTQDFIDNQESSKTNFGVHYYASSRSPLNRSGHFNCIASKKTQPEDMTTLVGLGSTGTFCHHSTCRHTLSLTDVRAWNPYVDSKLPSEYPYLIYRAKKIKN